MSGRAPGKKYEGPGNPTHGLSSTYRAQAYACRCQPCRDANRVRQRREDASRKARLEADPTLAPHGVVSTYTNWGCRCEPCKAAQAEANRRGHLRRKTEKEVGR